MSGASDHIDEEAFDKTVDDLQRWLKRKCICPECAVSVLGSVVGVLIWNHTIDNKTAKEEAADFCARLMFNIQVLSEMEPDASEAGMLQ